MDETEPTYGSTPPHVAAAIGHLGCLRALLRQGGAAVDKRDAEGWTLLHYRGGSLVRSTSHSTNSLLSHL